MRLSSPWIIELSVHIYKLLLALGPADFRQEFAELAAQTFRQCCQDVYQHGGTLAVLQTWPLAFSEAIVDMLAERFSQPASSPESCQYMFYTMRRSMVTIFCAFVLFATAYVCLHSIAGSEAQSTGFAQTHDELNFTFTVIKYSTNIAFLAIALGGLPLLFTVTKHALTDAYNHPLLSFFITAGQALAFFPLIVRSIVGILGYSIVVNIAADAGFIRPSLESLLSFVFLADILFLIIIAVWIGAASPTLSIPRHDFSATLLYLARIPMFITALAMSVALSATLVWAARLWMIEPLFPPNGPGIGGNSFLLLFVFAAMTFSCTVAAQAIRSNANHIQSFPI